VTKLKVRAIGSADAFCTRNGYRLDAPEGEPAIILEAVAANEIEEAGLTLWFRRRTKKLPG
jgi:prophage maintenance system killer protein